MQDANVNQYRDLTDYNIHEEDTTTQLLNLLECPKEEEIINENFTELQETLEPLDIKYYIEPYNYTRRIAIQNFSRVLYQYEEFTAMPRAERVTLLDQLEKACYNYSIEVAYERSIMASWEVSLFIDIYSAVCYKISSNLDKGPLVANERLAQNILTRKINIEQLPYMKSIDMCPEKYTHILERLEVSKNVEQKVKTTTLFKCGKCKKNECTAENLYNRSFDEGTNLKVTCQNCGFSFTA
jgi:DNA-directed RNA polymerase subunit M/transcription elongation factor TFIIS